MWDDLLMILFKPSNCFRSLLAGVLIVVGSMPSSHATSLRLTIDSKTRTASLNIPANVNSVLVQSRPVAGGKWVNYKTLPVKAVPASLRVTLPGDFSKKSWRATGAKVTTPPAKRKYPERFFAGKKFFGETVASSYTKDAPSANMTALRADDAKLASPTSTSASVEESDIWKADGSTVYFFNQLRGLQVLDLSDPANPTLMASYRLPSKGQEMYIVRGNGEVRYAILLTSEYDRITSNNQTGIQVIKIDGSSAKLVSSLNVTGWLADSRLVGNRIYLATQQWSWNSSANTDAVTLNDIVLDNSSGSVTLAKTHAVKGNWPVISAGNDWLAVTQSDWSDWQSSWITLFSLDTDGATKLTASPVKLFGRLDNRYYVQYENGLLSTVSQRGWWNNQEVVLENFDSGGSKMGSVEIMKNENLMSARFAGNKAYVVTFRQTDPLFVVDLSDATNPVIAGHLEVPGFSTHIEPIGDKLFTIGFENGKVAASIFDVSDPSNPAISTNGRILLDGTWGYSAATYNDKALKVLPDHGIALIPYTSYDSTTGSDTSYIQILNMDLASGNLTKGGVINHRFDPLRANLVNGALASISQKELVMASLPNHGNPTLLADLLLAWPVNRFLTTANHLIQIEEGASSSWWGWYGSGAATVRVSPLNDPDSGLTEIPLGNGVVKDAILRGNSLYILRQNPDNPSFWGWCWYAPTTQTKASPTITLDIYDASRLPDLKLSGSTSIQLPGNDSAWDLSGMLFPSARSAVVVAQPQARGFRWRGRVMPMVVDPLPDPVIAPPAAGTVSVASGRIASCMPYPFDGYQPPQSTNPAIAVVFQVENPAAPVGHPVIPLTDTNATPVVSPAAAGGMLVYGYAVKEKPLSDGTELSTSQHALRTLDLNDPAAPILGPALALPGRLAGVSDITTDGFLAWTLTRVKGTSGAGQLQVSACDLASLTQITGMTLKNSTAVTAVGRTLFAVQGKDVARYSLNDSGVLAETGKVTFDWQPSSLRISTNPTGTLLGADSQNLFSWSYNDPKAQVLDWATERPVDVLKASVLTNRSVLAPAGEYGVDEYLP
jgi:uncharacterized secreted protein with C-terminal beta-propeller domain